MTFWSRPKRRSSQEQSHSPSPRPMVEPLEERRMLAAPVISNIIDQVIPAGRSLIIPVRGQDADGDRLTYTVKSKSANVVARLHATGQARTLRKDSKPFLVTDGPYAETKEQILGFYVVDCVDAEEAMAIARELGEANPGGAFEVRPISYFQPGEADAGGG